jgi:V-type H+-transporting ATPase subunit G
MFLVITTDRVQRLKDARNEALKEIDLLKATKLQEFASYEKSYENNIGKVNSDQLSIMENEQTKVKNCFEKNKDLVIEKLLKQVQECVPHRNLSHLIFIAHVNSVAAKQ